MFMFFNRTRLRDRLDDSTLRLLSEAEIEWVAGGGGPYGSGGYGADNNEEIVVKGKRYKKNAEKNYWYLADSADPGYGYDYNDNSGSPGYGDMEPSHTNPPPRYSTPGTSQAANSFADTHVKFEGSSQDVDKLHRAHDDMANFYDWATKHPNSSVNIGNNLHITASQALSDLSHVNYIITNDDLGGTAARTIVSADGTSIDIKINPQSTSYAYYSMQPGSTGFDYLLFHETGHSLNYFHNQSLFNTPGVANEDAANAAAHSIESQMGIDEMPVAPNNH